MTKKERKENSGEKPRYKNYFCGICRRQLKDATVQCFEEIQKEPAGSFYLQTSIPRSDISLDAGKVLSS